MTVIVEIVDLASDAVDAELLVDCGKSGGVKVLVNDELRKLWNQCINRFIRHLVKRCESLLKGLTI